LIRFKSFSGDLAALAVSGTKVKSESASGLRLPVGITSVPSVPSRDVTDALKSRVGAAGVAAIVQFKNGEPLLRITTATPPAFVITSLCAGAGGLV
jgi:hypothetical protein